MLLDLEHVCCFLFVDYVSPSSPFFPFFAHSFFYCLFKIVMAPFGVPSCDAMMLRSFSVLLTASIATLFLLSKVFRLESHSNVQIPFFSFLSAFFFLPGRFLPPSSHPSFSPKVRSPDAGFLLRIALQSPNVSTARESA